MSADYDRYIESAAARTVPRFYSTTMMRSIDGFGWLGFSLSEPFLVRRVYVKDSSGGQFEQCAVSVVLNRKLYVYAPVWLLKDPAPLLRVPILAAPDRLPDGWWDHDSNRLAILVKVEGGSITAPRLNGKNPDLTVYLDGELVVGKPEQ